MKYTNRLLWVILFTTFLLKVSAEIRVEGLKVQSMAKPVGIGNKVPYFSWQWTSDRRNSFQTAYRILVASSKENLQKGNGDLWESGLINSGDQNFVDYKGKALQSGRVYFWKVKIRDNHQQESPWSQAGSFTMGLLNASEWKAKWITYDTLKAISQPIFRKSFSVQKKIKSAVAFISGLGYYEFYLNGKKVGDHVLDPGQTNYEDYAIYVTYDVTKLLKRGENMAGVMLGDGWYNQDKVWGKNGFSYGKPLLLCQVCIEYEDGTLSQILSDQSWQWTNGPVQSSNVYAGEVYDARKEIEGWNTASQSNAEWMPAVPAKVFPPRLVSQEMPPIRKMMEIPAKKLTNPEESVYIFDFGQNFAGWTRLKVNAPAGTKITIRTAEEVDKEGKLYTASTGVTATKVEQTEVYTCKGGGTEIWEARFTYHGFRYAEVTGLPYKPDLQLLTGIVVYTSFPENGEFSCSDNQFNRLHQLAKWTLISNLHSIPTDCPAREKCGWLGDAHAMVTFGIYNLEMQNFWIKYLYDIRSTSRDEAKGSVYKTWNKQENRIKPAGIPYMIAPGKRLGGAASPDWGTALVQIPWNIYLYYGNVNVLKEFYQDMKRWVDYVEELAVDNIIDYGLGDWCPPGMIVPTEIPVKVSSTAFHYLDTKTLAEVASLLGYPEDAALYRKKEKVTREAFIAHFYDSKKKTFGSQTANSMALDFGLAPEGESKFISNEIARNSKENLDGFLNTGIFGIPRIFGALSQYGNEKDAYNILTKKGYNSFEYMWAKYQATTLWEILPVDSFYLKLKNPMSDRSHSHPMQGGYDRWFYQNVLGINADPQNPGFKQIRLKPEMIQQLKWAKGEYLSVYGWIKSGWETDGLVFRWNISIPSNTKAIVYIPGSADQIKEGGRLLKTYEDIRYLRTENGRSIFEVGSGDYSFTSNLKE